MSGVEKSVFVAILIQVCGTPVKRHPVLLCSCALNVCSGQPVVVATGNVWVVATAFPAVLAGWVLLSLSKATLTAYRFFSVQQLILMVHRRSGSLPSTMVIQPLVQ